MNGKCTTSKISKTQETSEKSMTATALMIFETGRRSELQYPPARAVDLCNPPNPSHTWRAVTWVNTWDITSFGMEHHHSSDCDVTCQSPTQWAAKGRCFQVDVSGSDASDALSVTFM